MIETGAGEQRIAEAVAAITNKIMSATKPNA